MFIGLLRIAVRVVGVVSGTRVENRGETWFPSSSPPEHERTRARDELGPRITALLFFFLLRFCFQLARFIRLTRRFFLALDNDTFFFSFFLFFGLTLNGVKIIMIIIIEEWIDVFCYRNNEERS